MPTQTIAVHHRSQSETIAFLGEVIALRLTGEQTGGAVAIMEHLLPCGTATPLHVHAAEDEAFYVLDGEVRVWLDGEITAAAAGDVVWLPRGIAHAFTVDSTTAHLLALAVPSGHEHFFRLAGQPAGSFDLSPVAPQPPDMERMLRAAAETGLEILGPPPFPEAS